MALTAQQIDEIDRYRHCMRRQTDIRFVTEMSRHKQKVYVEKIDDCEARTKEILAEIGRPRTSSHAHSYSTVAFTGAIFTGFVLGLLSKSKQ